MGHLLLGKMQVMVDRVAARETLVQEGVVVLGLVIHPQHPHPKVIVVVLAILLLILEAGEAVRLAAGVALVVMLAEMVVVEPHHQ